MMRCTRPNFFSMTLDCTHATRGSRGFALFCGLLLSRIAFWGLLVCTLSCATAEAAFVLPKAAEQASDLLLQTGDFSVSSGVFATISDELKANRRFSSGGAGAAHEPSSNAPPAMPSRELPRKFALLSGFSFGSGERGSSSSSTDHGSGGSAGSFGIMCSLPKLTGSLSHHWLSSTEFRFVPSTLPSDIFRPPPISLRQLS
jgi:hypothetical protein